MKIYHNSDMHDILKIKPNLCQASDTLTMNGASDFIHAHKHYEIPSTL